MKRIFHKLTNKDNFTYGRLSKTNLAVFALIFAGIGGWLIITSRADSFDNVVSKPIDIKQYTGTGSRSHWMQPWRSYFEAMPASSLLNSTGASLNIPTKEIGHAARVLAANGFTWGRIAIYWNNLSFDNPKEFKQPTEITAQFKAFKDSGLRPMVQLMSHRGEPTPIKNFHVTLVEPALKGVRQVKLDSVSATQVIPHRTGLSGLTRYHAAEAMFVNIDKTTGIAQLSKPLPKDLAAGKWGAATLKYGPFGPQYLNDGSESPQFKESLQGWREYVLAIATKARAVLGNDNFDIEVWNELSNNSEFLTNIGAYYDPVPPFLQGPNPPYGRILLEATVKTLRDNGFNDVRVSDGFSAQTPFASPVDSPDGMTAISKHLGTTPKVYPKDTRADGIHPVDGLGQQIPGICIARPPEQGGNLCKEKFIPTYTARFPEFYLSALLTEHMVTDIRPITPPSTHGKLHGRNVLAPDGKPREIWKTEWTMGVDSLFGKPAHKHVYAKVMLRSVSSYINKGAARMNLFGAGGVGDLNLIDKSFYDTIKTTGTYPGDNKGGEIIDSFKSFFDGFKGAEPMTIDQTRKITLDKIADNHNHIQFKGEGTPEHPDLYNRDVLAVLPFQVNQHKFVIPTYVMTRDVAKSYNKSLNVADGLRYDMPEEKYRITLGNVNGISASVKAYDPLLSNKVTPVSIVSKSANHIEVEMSVTDSPRMLTIDETGASISTPAPTPGHAPYVTPSTTDTSPPTVIIYSPTNNAVVSGKIVPIMAASIDDRGVSSFQFKINNNTYEAHEGGLSYYISLDTTTLPNGTHTVTGIAKDSAGNTNTATTTIVVNNTGTPSPPPPPDTTSPNTTISSNPSNSTTSTDASFSFSSTESNSTFECQLDTGSYTPCTSPKAYSGLAVDSHTFSVRAKDIAGNIDSTSAIYTWTIIAPAPPPSDTTAPTMPTNLRSPAKTTTSISLAWNASSDSGGSGLKHYNLFRNGTFITSTTQLNYTHTGLAAGISYSFRISAVDNAGTESAQATAINVSTAANTTPPPPLAPPVAAIPTKRGDVDGNNKVDIFDLSILLTRYRTTSQTADIDKNGKVDIFDLSILLSNYGK